MSPPSPSSIRIGTASEYWLYNPSTGYDLTRSLHPRLTLRTTTSLPITICPSTTALVIIDMQNFFLNPAAGRPLNQKAMAAKRKLVQVGVPTCREAGIRVIWLTWGVEERELEDGEGFPLSVLRSFGSVLEAAEGDLDDVDGHADGVVKETFGQRPTIGEDIGDVELQDGKVVAGGKLLIREQWNTALHPPLQDLYMSSQSTALPDVRFDKSRISGFSDADQEVVKWLKREGIKTLLFAGVNTDQCVAGSLMDAAGMGFDCVLMRDGCATGSPDFARKGVEWNGRKNLGWVSDLDGLRLGVERMRHA